MTTSASEAASSARPSIVRHGPIGLVREGLRDLWNRRRLVGYLVGADAKRTHADSFFGRVWWILDPILQVAVYWVLVTVIFDRKTPDYPLFLFAAILPWKWFSTSINDTVTSITSRDALIRQVQFPKIVLPSAAVIAGVVGFIFGMLVLALFALLYPHRLTAWILLYPVIAGLQFVYMLGLGILLAAANAFYRDVQNVMRHVIRLWYFLSPAIYSIDQAPSGSVIHTILTLNPFSILLTSYRDVVWGHSSQPLGPSQAPDFVGLAALLVLSIVQLAIAIGIFKRVEPAFARIL